MSGPLRRLAVLRAAEAHCLQHGVDTLSLAAIAKAVGASGAEVSTLFHDEVALLDAVLERHQSPYERGWETILPTIDTPRAALHLLVSTLARVSKEEDGGAAYISIAAQMCSGTRFNLTGRPATTTPMALQLISKLA